MTTQSQNHTGEAFGGRVSVVRRVEPGDQPEGQSAPHAHHHAGLPRHELQLQRRRAADAPDQRGQFVFCRALFFFLCVRVLVLRERFRSFFIFVRVRSVS